MTASLRTMSTADIGTSETARQLLRRLRNVPDRPESGVFRSPGQLRELRHHDQRLAAQVASGVAALPLLRS